MRFEQLETMGSIYIRLRRKLYRQPERSVIAIIFTVVVLYAVFSLFYLKKDKPEVNVDHSGHNVHSKQNPSDDRVVFTGQKEYPDELLDANHNTHRLGVNAQDNGGREYDSLVKEYGNDDKLDNVLENSLDGNLHRNGGNKHGMGGSIHDKVDSLKIDNGNVYDDITKDKRGRARDLKSPDDAHIKGGKTKALPNVSMKETFTEKSPLEIYVFEEHHEAIPYWFAAVDKGLLPKYGNTLIHIDGHSDMVQPFNVEGMPSFTWPRKDQIRLLMQRNDGFIQTAAMSGMISRVIWVWPEWDRKDHEGGDHVGIFIDIGWATVPKNSTNETKTEFCNCMITSDNETVDCNYYNESFLPVEIKREQCVSKYRIEYEEVSEMAAVSLLRTKHWIKPNESVFWDIDEDFFGCSYVIQPLLDSNVTAEWVETFDEQMRFTLCPKTTVQETETNQILLQVVSLLNLQKSCRDQRSKCPASGLQLRAEDILTSLLTDAHKSNKTIICAQDGESATVDMLSRSLVVELSNLTAQQLSLIQRMGFCLEVTPKDSFMFRPQSFGLCYGANTPEHTAVSVFNPTAQDIRKRSIIMRLMIEATVYNPPKIVTLCRSGRDGFTPVKYFPVIERAILTHFNNTFKHTYVHYDSDLMGGEEGRTHKLRKH